MERNELCKDGSGSQGRLIRYLWLIILLNNKIITINNGIKHQN